MTEIFREYFALFKSLINCFPAEITTIFVSVVSVLVIIGAAKYVKTLM